MSSKATNLEADIGGKLSLKNFDVMHAKVELSAQSLFPYAGRILSKRGEVVRPVPIAPRLMVSGSAEEMLHQERIKEYVRAERQYELQKESIAIEIQRILDDELKRLMEADPAYGAAKDSDPPDTVGMWKAIHDKIASGVHFTGSHFLLQVKKIVNAKMSDKESLSTYRHRFAEDLVKSDIMAAKLKIAEDDFKLHPVFKRLFAGFFLEKLNPRFDDLRKDLRSDTMSNVKYPNDMGEAITLAEKYDGLKGSALTAKDSQYEVVGAVNVKESAITTPAVANNNKKGKANAKKQQKEKEKEKAPAQKSSAKKNDSGFYTDPNSPPPKPWPGMKYCGLHKRWCKHSTDECTLKEGEKVNLCFDNSEEELPAWSGWDQH